MEENSYRENKPYKTQTPIPPVPYKGGKKQKQRKQQPLEQCAHVYCSGRSLSCCGMFPVPQREEPSKEAAGQEADSLETGSEQGRS